MTVSVNIFKCFCIKTKNSYPKYSVKASVYSFAIYHITFHSNVHRHIVIICVFPKGMFWVKKDTAFQMEAGFIDFGAITWKPPPGTRIGSASSNFYHLWRSTISERTVSFNDLLDVVLVTNPCSHSQGPTVVDCI